MKKVYNAREFAKLLKDNGYSYDRTRGDHVIYYKGSKHVSFTARNLNPMIVRRLIKENNLQEVA